MRASEIKAETDLGRLEQFICHQRQSIHSAGDPFIVPDHGSIENALVLARDQCEKSQGRFQIIVRAGRYRFREPIILHESISLSGEGRPSIVGTWNFNGGNSVITGVEFECSGGRCLTVENGEVLLEHCSIFVGLHLNALPSTLLICTGGLVTLRQCNLRGKSSSDLARDGIAVCGKGRVLAELSKLYWCEFAVSAGDTAQVTFIIRSSKTVSFDSSFGR